MSYVDYAYENQILIAENQALAAQNEVMRKALEEARDDVSIVLTDCMLIGGYPSTDRHITRQREQLERHDAALCLPDRATEILRARDEALIERCAKEVEKWQDGLNRCIWHECSTAIRAMKGIP